MKIFHRSLIILFTTTFLFGIAYLTYNYFDYQQELKKIGKREIRGIIIKSKNEDRGFYYVEIDDDISKSKLCYSLPSSWFFKDNNIKVNDSVSKVANSKIMTFYKKQNGIYIKCCDYELEM